MTPKTKSQPDTPDIASTLAELNARFDRIEDAVGSLAYEWHHLNPNKMGRLSGSAYSLLMDYEKRRVAAAPPQAQRPRRPSNRGLLTLSHHIQEFGT